jgi:hypothetical protein
MLPSLGALQLWEEEMLSGTLPIPLGTLDILDYTIQWECDIMPLHPARNMNN